MADEIVGAVDAAKTRLGSRAGSVAIVVVLYNSQALLSDLVASLAAGLEQVDWHLIAVDNASSDDSVKVLADLAPDAEVVRLPRNAGYAAGINAGVAAAGPHEAVLVLNPDVRLDRGCVGTLLTALREPGVGIAVPRLRDANGQRIDSMRREPSIRRALGDAFLGARRAGRYPTWGEVVTDPELYDWDRTTDWAEGSTQLISAECWRASGPWDESYFLYSEEAEFDLRARDLGYATRYVPTATATHLEGEGSPGQWALLVVNRVRFFRRRNGLLRTIPFWAAVLLREGSRALLGRRASRSAVLSLSRPSRMCWPPGPQWLEIGRPQGTDSAAQPRSTV